MNWHKFNPFWWFLNDDQPQPPAEFKSNWPALGRWLYWLLVRNPLHNFMFYVLGIADEVRSGAARRRGIDPRNVFRAGGGFNATYFDRNERSDCFVLMLIYMTYLVLALLEPGLFSRKIACAYPILFLLLWTRPFISYQNRWVMAYIGWRESGAFGVKLIPNQG